MQATVLEFDATTRSGRVVRDDGTTMVFDSAAFDAGGLRLVRPGQRVLLVVTPAGAITALTVATLDLPGGRLT